MLAAAPKIVRSLSMGRTLRPSMTRKTVRHLEGESCWWWNLTLASHSDRLKSLGLKLVATVGRGAAFGVALVYDYWSDVAKGL